MHTHLRRRGQTWLWLAPLAFCFGWLSTGCQSIRPGYSFQPITTTLVPEGPVAASVADIKLSPQQHVTALETAPAIAETHPAARRHAVRQWLGAPQRLAFEPRRVANAPVQPPRRLRAAPHATAEAGLGRTVLFIVGVVLAVLAGLAALVSLIPGVSFWGGLGLAVGGLLVLGLIYKLFSGKKKA